MPPSEHPIADLVRDHNLRLAAEGCPLRIERRGGRLALRGPLPARGGAGETLVVQRISLGLSASEAGVEESLVRLRRLRRQLGEGTFRWQDWIRRPSHAGPSPDASTGSSPGEAESQVEQGLQEFERAFFADPRRRRRPSGSRTTWSAAYRPYLRRLAALAERPWEGTSAATRIDLPLLERVVETYPLASRSRQQCGIVLGALARHQGVALPEDWSERCSGYGLHAARFRQLPSDAEILDLVHRIPNPSWRLAYGLMATYGLRNHEVFFCDCSALAPGGDRVVRVLPTSKTGEHQVWPFQPDWVARFGLESLGRHRDALPPVTTDLRHTTLQQVGRRVAEQFRRYDLPITPYDLRHAWAVRTIHIGLPDTVAARMMGHSVAIHTRTYHHWITRRDQQQAVDAALARQSVGSPAASP